MGTRLPTVVAMVIFAVTSGSLDVHVALGVPIKLAMSRRIGWEAAKVSPEKICVIARKNDCLSSKPSSEPGGFEYPSSVSVDIRTGNLYVADLDNYRVQEFTAGGAFIAMFGWGVNETKSRLAKSSQAEKNVCTASSGDRCKAGVDGTASGQLTYPVSVAVDPISGDVYVLEFNTGDSRVDKYTADGRFVWRIGKGVNEATKGNICNEREVERFRAKCKAGKEASVQSTEHAAFKFAPQNGNLLAVGGPGSLLYVGDEHRVQEFDGEGKWKGEILLTSISSESGGSVGALAVERDGTLYLVYRTSTRETGTRFESVGIIRKFNPDGEQVAQILVNPRRVGAIVHIDGIAVDSTGLIAVIGVEIGSTFHQRFGSLYDVHTGRLVSEFAPPKDNDGLTFSSDMYVAATDDHEVIAYVPAPLMELVEVPAACQPGDSYDPTLAFGCALNL